MEAIDLNDDGQNDLMDEDIEDHEVIEISEANRGTPPRHAQSRRRARLWLKFTIIGGQRPDGKTKIRCNLCKRFYFIKLRKNGTSTMSRHLKEKHVSSFVKDTTDHPRHHPIPSEEPELQSRVFL